MLSIPEQLAIDARLLPDETENALQNNPARLPEGFHFVKKYNGEDAGIGFYCNRCKLHVPSHSPAEVKHCGTVSAVPTSWWKRVFKMKTHTLSRRGY